MTINRVRDNVAKWAGLIALIISLGNSAFSIYDQRVLQPQRDAVIRQDRDLARFEDLIAQIGAVNADTQQRMAAVPDYATKAQMLMAGGAKLGPLVERAEQLYKRVGAQATSLELNALAASMYGTFGADRALPIMQLATDAALREKNLAVASNLMATRAQIIAARGPASLAEARALMDRSVAILAVKTGQPTALWHAQAQATYAVFEAQFGDCARAQKLLGAYRGEIARTGVGIDLRTIYERSVTQTIGDNDRCALKPLLIG